jgi:uncharacterized membrane protein YraQ (UPF0718 family)
MHEPKAYKGVSRPLLAGLVGFIAIVGTLITYKAGGAMTAIAKVEAGGGISSNALWYEGAAGGNATVVHTINYVGWVAIALAYGLLLGAAIKAVLPRAWLARSLEGPRGQILGGLFGAPLMLCSCCATPVFEGVYKRTGRLGPSLAMLLAPPGLNPAALVLTFLLFPAPLGLARLVLSVLLVVAGTACVAHFFPGTQSTTSSLLEEEAQSWTGLLRAFAKALLEVTMHSLPAILLGIVLSAWLITSAPIPEFAASLSGFPLLIMVGLVATLIAIPTFAEIPIALALLQAGAPNGVVLTVLVAAPLVNLPSLLGLAKLASPKVALATGAMVFLACTGAGMVFGF